MHVGKGTSIRKTNKCCLYRPQLQLYFGAQYYSTQGIQQGRGEGGGLPTRNSFTVAVSMHLASNEEHTFCDSARLFRMSASTEGSSFSSGGRWDSSSVKKTNRIAAVSSGGLTIDGSQRIRMSKGGGGGRECSQVKYRRYFRCASYLVPRRRTFFNTP